MIGNEYEYILTQNDLFSRGSFLCHRAELALKCLQSADKNEGNHPFYTIWLKSNFSKKWHIQKEF